MILNMKIVIYTTSGCPRCAQLKRMLDEKQIPYEEMSDTEQMIKMGIRGNMPLLQVDDGERMPLFKAIPFIKSL